MNLKSPTIFLVNRDRQIAIRTPIKSAQDPVVTKLHLKNKKPPTGDIIEELIVKNGTLFINIVNSKLNQIFFFIEST